LTSFRSSRPALRDVGFGSIAQFNCTLEVTTINTGNVTLGPSSFCIFTNNTQLGCNSRRLFPGEAFVVSLSVESYPENHNINFTVKSTFGDDCNSEIFEHQRVYQYQSCLPSSSTSPTTSISRSSSTTLTASPSSPQLAASSLPQSYSPSPSPLVKTTLPRSSHHKSSSPSRTPTSTPQQSICSKCEVGFFSQAPLLVR